LFAGTEALACCKNSTRRQNASQRRRRFDECGGTLTRLKSRWTND
jgi:hypothetical protein